MRHPNRKVPKEAGRINLSAQRPRECAAFRPPHRRVKSVVVQPKEVALWIAVDRHAAYLVGVLSGCDHGHPEAYRMQRVGWARARIAATEMAVAAGRDGAARCIEARVKAAKQEARRLLVDRLARECGPRLVVAF